MRQETRGLRVSRDSRKRDEITYHERNESGSPRHRKKLIERNHMAKKDKSTESVYRVTEVIGTSANSWEAAAAKAVETASSTLRDLRIAEVIKMDLKIEDGKVLEYRTRLQLSFKYES
jgi:flavin-binding protein dodecin